MAGKKQLLAELAYRSGLSAVASRAMPDRCIVFGEHRIKPNDPSFASAFADDVFGTTVAEFEAQVGWLKKHTTVLSQDRFLGILAGDDAPKGLSSLITFDDGYKDNFELAYPVLRKHDVPAVFFVPSKIIDERRLGWWDVIAYLLKKTTEQTITLDGETFDLTDRDDTIGRLHKRMQLEKADQTKDLVDRLAACCRVTVPSPDEHDRELMSWDDLRTVSRNGVDVCSHTHSHRVLATLPAETQRSELVTSKAFLEEKLDRPVRSLAYPVGGYQHFTAETARIAEACGYDCAYSFCTGYNTWDTIATYDVKRIGAPTSLSLFVATTVLPEVFDWV